MNKQLLERIQDLSGILDEMAQPASEEEYYGAISDYYDNNEELLEIIKQGERMARHMSRGGEEHIQKTDYGNVIVKWFENDEVIFLLGIVSKTGKIKKEDIPDINKWINNLVEKIKDGKILYTSPNKISEKLLIKIIKKLKDKGIEIDKQETPGLTLGDEPHLSWKNIIIRRK